MSRTIVFCPKCNCEEIKTVRVDLNAENTSRVSMDDYEASRGGAVPAVMVSRHYRMICAGCGYSVDYAEGGGW